MLPVLVVPLLALFGLSPVQPGHEPGREPERGAVVENVEPGSSAETAGIRPGDLLLSWSLQNGGGPVANPVGSPVADSFGLDQVGIEQAPRGEVTLAGRRERQDREWTVKPGSWGLEARPTLREDLLSLYQEGREKIAAGDLEAGAGRWRSAVEVAERQGDAPRAAWLQDRLAGAFAAAHRWTEADALWESAAQRLEKSEPAAAAQILRTWGETLQQRNEWDRAVAVYRRALASTPAESLAAVSEISALGIIASRRGDLAAAEDLFRQAHALVERVAPTDRTLAKSENHLAIVAADRGRLDEAGKYFLDVLEREERLAPESAGVATVLSNLGKVASMRGDLAAAEERYRRALAISERLAPDSQDVATKLGKLGMVEVTRGDLAVAEEHFRRALAIDEREAPESLEVASDLNQLGILADKRGDFTAAAEYHRRALAIREKRAPGSPDVAVSLANLGWLEARRNHLETADELLRRAFEIQERYTPGGLPTVGPLTMRAGVALRRDDLAAAEQLHLRALAILEKEAPGGLRVSDSLERLGLIALRKGDLARAEDLFNRSLAICEKLAPDSTRIGTVLNDLGEVYHQQGRRELAARFSCDALDVLDRQRRKVGGPVEGQSAFGGRAAEYYRDCAAALVEAGRPEEAFHALERGRARAFLDFLADRDLQSDLPPDLARERRALDTEYDRTQQSLERSRPADQTEVDRLLVRLRELRARQAEVAAKVRQTSPREAALRDPQPLDLVGARRTLDPGTVLLAWSIAQDRSFLFVVLPAGEPGRGLEVFPLPVTDAALRQRVESFRNLLQRDDSDRRALTTQAKALYDLLLRPAEARIAAADRLLLLPDGPLHALPFAALRRGGRWLAEQKPIHTALSATAYAAIGKSGRREAGAAPATLVAFGDPSYPPLPAGQSAAVHPDVRAAVGRGLSLTSLPATREEVRDIASLFPGARVLLGTEATEERAKAIGKDVRYLHFACHGLLDERFPLNSSLALAIPQNPADGQENGLLQAWEIFESVRLDADLVTLSACDTALGEEAGGEGLLGLTRAFQHAGARSVLASLWSVSDVSTGELMKSFYAHLRAGKTKAEALQAAQTALIRSRTLSHPYHWAAFQLSGDWR